MDDHQIIGRYWDRSELAIVETDRKYGAFCSRIAFNILNDRCDSEECVSDTWLKAWNTIPPGRPEKLAAFLGKITRNLAISRWRADRAEKRGGGMAAVALEELGECVPGGKDPEEILEQKQLVMLLNRFLEELPGQTRRIFLLRYWAMVPLKQIAGELRCSESKIKMTLLRTRNKLRAFLEQEGVAL